MRRCQQGSNERVAVGKGKGLILVHLERKNEERTIFELDCWTQFPSTALCMLEVEKFIRHGPLGFM